MGSIYKNRMLVDILMIIVVITTTILVTYNIQHQDNFDPSDYSDAPKDQLEFISIVEYYEDQYEGLNNDLGTTRLLEERNNSLLMKVVDQGGFNHGLEKFNPSLKRQKVMGQSKSILAETSYYRHRKGKHRIEAVH